MNRITRSGRTTLQVAVCFALLLAFAVAANAQTFVTATTSTTLWGGSQDTTTFGFSAYTAPFPGVILTGTAISTITGKPVRHLWYGDPLNGFCRIDPEVDAVIPPVAGIGGHNPNIQSCLASIQAKGITPGQVAYDAANQLIYSEDTSRTNAGIFRLQYVPSGDNGQGAVNIVSVTSLVGTQLGRNAFGGCGQMFDPKTGQPVPVVPNSAALGPDGNLYTGSIRDGALIRIIGPNTFDPNVNCPLSTTLKGSDPSKLNLPGDRLQIPILSSDEKFGSGHTFGLGFIGTTLFGADNIAPWIMTNATQCLTPINGNKMCASPALSGQAQMPIEILAAQVAGPQAGLITDAVFPNLPGAVMYAATFPNVTRVTNILTATAMTVNQNYGGNFNFITGLAADSQDPNNATVYVGTDPTQGGINGSGQIWQVTAVAQNIPPATPVVTSAAAGPGTGQATVTWAPVLNGAPISTYVVQTLLASLTGGAPTPSTIPNVTVTAPTTSAVISGLTVGTAYVFEVQACNAFGCSAFSAPSSIITAFAVTVPPAPTNVLGVAVGNGTSAAVSWTQSGNGNSPITSSTILTTGSAGAPLIPNTVILGSSTGGTVNGLTCGFSYTFRVFATNAVGSSATSAASLAVSIPCVTTADVSLTMSAPATINAGSILTYTLTVSNGGPAPAPQVLISDTLPAPFVSSTTTQGVCAGAVGVTTMSCNLGSMAAGATATITIAVQLPNTSGTFTNTATAQALSTAGVNVDPNLANNTATATTTANVVQQNTCTASTTDIQVGGSVNNGNPVHGTPVTFTWQIKNNQGTVNANCVTFTNTQNTTNLTVSSASSSIGTCSVVGNTVSCNVGTIPGGQTAIVSVSATPLVAAPANSYASTGNAQLGAGSTDTNPANNQFTVFLGAQ